MEFEIDQNLRLGLLRSADAETLFKVVDANRSYLRQWLPWLDHNTTPEDSAAYITGIQRQLDAGKGFACGVFFKDVLVGMCGYHEIDHQTQSVVIGYWLAEPFQKNGIISRCVAFFVSYAFNEFGLKKVLIPVAVQNTKSRAVCEHLGFVNEGTEVNAESLYGTYVDHIRYAMPADRWRFLRQK